MSITLANPVKKCWIMFFFGRLKRLKAQRVLTILDSLSIFGNVSYTLKPILSLLYFLGSEFGKRNGYKYYFSSWNKNKAKREQSLTYPPSNLHQIISPKETNIVWSLLKPSYSKFSLFMIWMGKTIWKIIYFTINMTYLHI